MLLFAQQALPVSPETTQVGLAMVGIIAGMVFFLERLAALLIHLRALRNATEESRGEADGARAKDKEMEQLRMQLALLNKDLNNGIREKVNGIHAKLEETSRKVDRISVLMEGEFGHHHQGPEFKTRTKNAGS